MVSGGPLKGTNMQTEGVDVTTMVTGNDDCGNANSWRSKRPKESDEVVQWEVAGGIAVWNFTLPYDAPREVAAALSIVVNK